MDASFRDWASLPAHIMDLIVTKLLRFSEYVRFCGVCPQWRCLALEAKVDHKVNLDLLKASRKKLPMLMFKTDENKDECRSLFSVSNRVIYNIKLPSPYKYRFAGSSLGWLFYLEKTMAVTLVNPCNKGRISLPVFKDPSQLFSGEWSKGIFDYYINKGILLSDPHASPGSFEVVVTYGIFRNLAFFKSGEPSWNFIEPESDFIVSDVIYYKGNLYGVDWSGKFVQIDLSSRTTKTIVPPCGDVFFGRVYLVESQDGELLMVKRVWVLNPDSIEPREDHHMEAEYYDNVSEYSDNESDSSDRITKYNLVDDLAKTSEFKVFKMTHPIEEGSATWVEINNIGEQALFLGDNHCVSVSTTEFPGGCLPNSIYFTSEHHHSLPPYEYCGPNEDSGIFNLENRSVSSHHVLGSSSMYIHPPIWFVPHP